MQTVKINSHCPHCTKDIFLPVPMPDKAVDLAPVVKSKITPVSSIFVYKITSEEIKQFILQMAREFVPDVDVKVAPRYCEKKRRKESDPRHSYASLRIAFSDNVVEKNADLGWYGKIGENTGNVRVVQSLMKGLIKKYQYDRKVIETWLKDYKLLEELEDGLGMTEAYIEDLRFYSSPRRIQSNTDESWIIFAAAAENVIQDMLTESGTDKVPGRIQIQDVVPISKEIVEFTVYLNPDEVKLRENPYLRQILLGEEKPKK